MCVELFLSLLPSCPSIHPATHPPTHPSSPQQKVRGLVVSIQQLSITGGILLAGALNVGLQHWEEGWRISYGGKGLFSILLMILMVRFLGEREGNRRGLSLFSSNN